MIQLVRVLIYVLIQLIIQIALTANAILLGY